MNSVFHKSMQAICGLLLVVVTIGCGPSAVRAPASDIDAAKTLLANSLEQWRSGKSFNDLSSSDPPIFFQDETFRQGAKLREFRILSSGEMYVTNVKFEVELQFAASDGQDGRQSKIEYLVTTVPAQTIARLE